uniref:RNA-binding S4 domain-containing protein n=1 Tax=Glycine max TaxID=3847 RepID=A0A0R0ED85_SOYBN
MGATTAIAALSLHCFSKSHTHFSPFRTLPRITCSFSSSIEFTISFAPPKPKPEPDASNDPDGPLLIPWIVRGVDAFQGGSAVLQPKHQGIPAARLSKVLAASGIASRRSCEELIFEGKVTVNGSVCNTPQTRVDPAKDVIYVNGSRLPKRQPQKVYLALNKPKGYICSSGENESKSVISLFDDFLKNWDLGHLDVATTGLIIVTNDDFAQKLSHPSSDLSKEYIATVDGLVHKRHLIAISEGTTVEGVHCVPDVVELLPHQPEMQRARIRIVVHEGRKHEVRELVKSAGLEIHSLKRVRIGGFRLPPDLGLGKYIELNSTNLNALGWKS